MSRIFTVLGNLNLPVQGNHYTFWGKIAILPCYGNPISAVMRHGQVMNYESLCAEAREAVKTSGRPQREIAAELDVTPGAISRAISEPGLKFLTLQKQLIHRLTDYQVIDLPVEPEFRILRKEKP